MNSTRKILSITAIIAAAGITAPLFAGAGRADAIRIAAAPGAEASVSRSESITRVDGDEVRILTEDGHTTITINGKPVTLGDQNTWTDEKSNIRVERRDGRTLVFRGDENIATIAEDGSFGFGENARRMRTMVERFRGGGGVEGNRFFGRAGPGSPGADAPPRVMLGVTLESISEAEGVAPEALAKAGENATVIRRVFKGLPASKAGLQEMDVIVEIDGSTNAAPEALRETLATKKPGELLKLKILRDGIPEELTVDLAPYDAQSMGAPRAFGWRRTDDGPPGFTGAFLSDEGIKRLEELRQSLSDSSTNMQQLAEALTKSGGKDSEAAARKMAALAAIMSEQSAELARKSAELTAGDFAAIIRESFPASGHFAFPGEGPPIRFRTSEDGTTAVIIAPDQTAPATDPSGGASGQSEQQRMQQIDQRLERLEALLERLGEQRNRIERERSPTPPPAPAKPN